MYDDRSMAIKKKRGGKKTGSFRFFWKAKESVRFQIASMLNNRLPRSDTFVPTKFQPFITGFRTNPWKLPWQTVILLTSLSPFTHASNSDVDWGLLEFSKLFLFEFQTIIWILVDNNSESRIFEAVILTASRHDHTHSNSERRASEHNKRIKRRTTSNIVSELILYYDYDTYGTYILVIIKYINNCPYRYWFVPLVLRASMVTDRKRNMMH